MQKQGKGQADAFRFAIMGAGGIAKKFCDAVSRVDGCVVAAVASKEMERAERFATENGLQAAAYDSYEQMLLEEAPDCVYIAVTHNAHYELLMLCLRHKVPVLCEKSMVLNSAQAKEVFALAAKQQVFVMEAMWSRFLPAIRQAQRWLRDGKTGGVSFLDMGIGFAAKQEDENRYYSPALGGGAAYDIGVYAYELCRFMMQDAPEKDAQVMAHWGRTGVDLSDSISLRFPDALASLRISIATPMEDRLVVYGPAGRVVVPRPIFAAEAFLYDTKGELQAHFVDEKTENGFVYEIQEAMQCVREGKLQSDVVPHALTVDCAKLFDRILETKPRG